MNNNVLEFFVKMKDMMSSGLSKLAQNAKQKSRDVTSSINDIIKKNDELSNSFEKVGRRAETAGSRIMGWGKGLAMALGAGAIIAGAGAFMKSSAQAAIQHEKTTKSFEVLTGNQGVGQSLAGSLNDLQQQTILGPEVFKNAQTMMAFGITADKVVPTLKMLGDVSMGDAERLQSLTLAFSQVSATGRLMGQDLLQMVNAGFNPLNEISKMTGKSMVDLKKEMEEGKISFSMVEEAFQHATGTGGLFNNMLNKMGETAGGKIAQLQGSVESLKIALGERMKPTINWFIGGLSAIVSKVKSWVEIPLETKLTDQIAKIRGLQAELTSSNTSHARQVELLKELEQINPKIVEGISQQNIEYGKLAQNIDNVTGALQKKIFLEKFDKANIDTLTRYSEAKQKYNENWAQGLAVLGNTFPDIAQRSDMTIGQKYIEAQKRLQASVNADPGKGFKEVFKNAGGGGGVYLSKEMTPEMDALNQIKTAVRKANEATGVITSLQPQVNQINKTKNAIQSQIDQFTGVKSMTAAQIQNSGGKAGGSSSSGATGKEVASGITGGGPRVININGVTLKVAEKMEVSTSDPKDFVEKMEPQLEGMLLRILNSGASIQ